MITQFLLKKTLYLLFKIKYFGKINFINTDLLKKHEGPAILISNHSYAIDLFIPMILSSLIHKEIFILAAAYPFTSKFKIFIAKKLGTIFVTKRLTIQDLKYITESLHVETDDNKTNDAYRFYSDLASKYNLYAKLKIDNILKNKKILYSFAQYHQPFFAMEKASDGLGKMIIQYKDVPIFPISIIDISNPPVEYRKRSTSNNLKRIDLLTEKKRKIFAGEINFIINNPIILKENNVLNPQEVIDDVMIYIKEKLPVNLHGYYIHKDQKGLFKYYQKNK